MTATRHNTQVARWQEDTSEGLAWCYQARCSCGVEMDEHYSERRARADLAEHLEAVAPPPEARCRQPRRHLMRPWDHCAVCAAQPELPGLEAWGAVG